MKIKGYKYANKQDAIDARETCDSYYGIPVTLDDVTQNWVDYQFAEYNELQFWYIQYDDSLLLVLGQPTEFEVIEPPLPLTNEETNVI